MNKTKICILCEYLSYVGGGERVYCSWANLFADKLEYDVTIVAMEDWNKPFFQLSDKVKVESLKLRKPKFYIDPIKRRREMILNFFSDRKAIITYLKKNNFDYILGIATNINLILSSIKTNAKKIATEHTEYNAPNFFIRSIRYFLYKNVSYITVLNYDDEKRFKRINKNTKVMLNPVEANELNKKTSYSNKLLISVGSLSPQKNQKQLIDIMNIIHKKYPEWKLVIYGDGPLRNELEEQVRKLSLQEVVSLPGNTNKIYEKMSEASIFLLTSSTEGFGLVLVEAMSAGLPCISFKTSGPKMIIEDNKTGFIIPLNDNNLFVEKLSLLIEDHKLLETMGENALNSSLKYSIDNIAKDWKTFFQEFK